MIHDSVLIDYNEEDKDILKELGFRLYGKTDFGDFKVNIGSWLKLRRDERIMQVIGIGTGGCQICAYG